MWASCCICIQKQRHSYIGSEIPRHFYHPRELRESITGPNVRSTALFHRCANSDRDLFPNMGSLIWEKFKVENIGIYCLAQFEQCIFKKKKTMYLKDFNENSCCIDHASLICLFNEFNMITLSLLSLVKKIQHRLNINNSWESKCQHVLMELISMIYGHKRIFWFR